VPHEDDARAAAALQERQPGPHVQHGLDVHAWVAVVEAQRSETLGRERFGQMRKDALGGPGVATASAPDPEHRPHSTRGALVQNSLDRAQSGVEHHPLAGVTLVGWAGVYAADGGRWGLSELAVVAQRSCNHRFLPPETHVPFRGHPHPGKDFST
jgi:hypothetical protein